MEFQSFSEKEFLQPFDNISIDDIAVVFMIYHNYEQPPENTHLEGKFSLKTENSSPLIALEDNPSSTKFLKSPFPNLIFTNLDDNSIIMLPFRRILSISENNGDVAIRFMQHGSNPVTGFSMEKKVAWGDISFHIDNESQLAQIQNLHSKFVINKTLPRPRCEICQGVLVLKSTSGESNEMKGDRIINEPDMICQDCLKGAFLFFNGLKSKMAEMAQSKLLSQSADILFQLIEGGLNLSDNLNDEQFKLEYHLLKAFILIEIQTEESIEEATPLLEEILMFATSWNLEKMKKKATNLLNSISPTKKTSKEELEGAEDRLEEIKEDKEQEKNDLTTNAIESLQAAKICENEGKFQEAIDLIYKAAGPLVESGIWGEEELIVAQGEVARLKKSLELEPEVKVIDKTPVSQAEVENIPPIHLEESSNEIKTEKEEIETEKEDIETEKKEIRGKKKKNRPTSRKPPSIASTYQFDTSSTSKIIKTFERCSNGR
jgi:hypothetical protein